MWAETRGAGALHDRLSLAADKLEERLRVPAESVKESVLVVMTGLPGSGKSQVAEMIAQAAHGAIVRSDEVRKALFSQPSYTGSESGVVHQVSYALIKRLLARRKVVVFDATNLMESHRRVLYKLAEAAGVHWMVVLVTAPENLILRRLELREAGSPPDAFSSDADRGVYQLFKGQLQPVRVPHHVVDTSEDVNEPIRQIIEEIRDISSGLRQQATWRQVRKTEPGVSGDELPSGPSDREGAQPK